MLETTCGVWYFVLDNLFHIDCHSSSMCVYFESLKILIKL